MSRARGVRVSRECGFDVLREGLGADGTGGPAGAVVTAPALRELADDPSSRKRFFRTMGQAGAVSAFGALLAACGDDEDATDESGESDAPAKGDLEIVNFALTLEHLESDFYRRAVDSGAIGDRALLDLLERFGQTEQEHVNALTATARQLGGPVAEKPRTNFDAVVERGPQAILQTAATVENLGAAAYLGQAPDIQDKEILAAALAIHTVEARHAAALNELVGRGFAGAGSLVGSVPDGPLANPLSMPEVLRRVEPFIAS